MQSISELITAVHARLVVERSKSNTQSEEDTRLSLTAGQQLFAQGDESDAVFIIVEGELSVRIGHNGGDEAEVNRHSAGAIVGEMAAMTNNPRTASVYAVTDALLERVDPESFRRLMADDPSFRKVLTEMVTHRWRQAALHEVLQDRFGTVDIATIRGLQEKLEWHTLSAGDTLFRQGDPSDRMYIVVSGRLHLHTMNGDRSQREIGEIAVGETVGEFGLLTNTHRSATVSAVRETNLASLTPAHFDELVQSFPSLNRNIMKLIIERQQRATSIAQRPQVAAFTVALVPASPNISVADFAQQLADAVQKGEQPLILTSKRFDQLYGQAGAAQVTVSDPVHPSILAWVGKLERQHQMLIYVGDYAWNSWTKRCLAQADHVLIIADPMTDPCQSEAEIAIDKLPVRLRTDLVLWHRAETQVPTGTAAWLAPRNVNAHHHVRHRNQSHMQRLVRLLCGNAICLVFSGGGARGFAHCGVYRALNELGIPIDYIGGTSMGAMAGGTIANGDEYEELIAKMRQSANAKSLFDYTLPYTSLMASRKVSQACKALYGEKRIEDLWTPFFCVSANLTQAEQTIHQHGSLWRAVRSSISLPGVFTPVIEGGDVLVDGGVMNNFPVDIMSRLAGSPHIIGVNVSPARVEEPQYDLDVSLSGWQILVSRLNPLRPRLSTPSLIETIVRTVEANSVQQTRRNEEQAELIIYPDTKAVGTLEFGNYSVAVEAGYNAAIEPLRTWQQMHSHKIQFATAKINTYP